MATTDTFLADEKLQQIRDAAFDAFLLYGFKRTSMEDIAAQAEMSRAALYLHFRNKRDIFRSVVEGIYDRGTVRFQAALNPSLPVAETVAEALRAKDDGIWERLLSSPHWSEFLGVGQEAASDISRAGEARLVEVLEHYFNAVLANRDVAARTPPGELAGHIVEVNHALYKISGPEPRRHVLLGQTAAALLGVD
ncbi:MAG: helix-turn-helix domain-containing protein [Pseudomonadota bacterium]